MNINQLAICEYFYSVQGEGPTTGKPAVFLRLAGCNLTCSGFTAQDADGKHYGCDSAALWRHGYSIGSDSLIQEWIQLGWVEKLSQGVHLVVTGGEPLLQETRLIQFLMKLQQLSQNKIFVELETNATIPLSPQLISLLSLINASPKLVHAKNSKTKCYQPTVLAQLAQLDKAIFKFVCSHPDDSQEIDSLYIQPFHIPLKRVWLMPEGASIQAINSKSLWMVELCKQTGYAFSARLQIHIWNGKSGF